MNDKEILESLIKHLKTNKNALARELNTSASTFRNIETGRNKISSKIAKSITDAFPEISYNWLMGGDCPMLVNPKEAPVDSLLLKRVETLERISEGQDARIKLQSLEITAQNTRIEKLEALFDTEKNLMPQSS